MKKKVTLKDISEKLNLSIAAVSKALRGHEGISEKTRNLVLETAKQMQYKGLAEESPPKPDEEKVIILVDERDIAEPHTMSLYYFIDSALKSRGLFVSLHGVSLVNREKHIAEILNNENPIGIFLFRNFSQKIVENLRKTNVNTIAIDFDYPHIDIDTVIVDNYSGAFLAVRHFIEMGHHQIGFIGDNNLSFSFLTRYHGFCHALKCWGVPLIEEYVYDLQFQDAFEDIHFNILTDQLNYDRLPTAFFCANDPVAFVLNNSLSTRGIRVPEEVSIIGFDNLDSCQWQIPPLTSVVYPRDHIAERAVDLLLWRMQNPNAPGNKLLIQPEMVIRESVATTIKK